MATIDQVRSLKQQGMNDSQIAGYLKSMGISPREVNNAMAQVNIKEAVSNPVESVPFNVQGSSHEVTQGDIQPGMQPSVMQSSQDNYRNPQSSWQNAGDLQPLPQEGPYAQEVNQEYNNVPQPGQESAYGNYPQEQYSEYDDQGYSSPNYPQQGYAQQGYEDYASQDTMSEIASQMVTEKTKSLAKKVGDLGEISVLLTAKVEKIDERLSRIESIIDQLQTSILRKATAQEQNISDIKTEMEAMQESFGKVINPLISGARKITHKTTKRKTHKKRKKK